MRRAALVLGAHGQLGEALTTGLATSFQVVARSRAEADITDPHAVRAVVREVSPHVVFNCAAYTNVDGAEREPSLALAINAVAIRTLAELAAERDLTLVHYSTDFVFDGETSRPYIETDPPNPRGAYAVSKLLGEWLATDAPRHYVLRVESLFGGPRAKSSVDRILDGLLSGVEVRAFADRTVSPSYVDDVVTATMALVERGSPYGVYHCVNSGHATWADLARLTAAAAGADAALVRDLPMSAANLLAPRPQFAALSNAKLAGEGIVMPTWQDAIRRYVHSRLARSRTTA